MNKRSLDNYIAGHYGEDQFDAAWEKFHEKIDDDTLKHGLSVEDSTIIWQRGLFLFLKERVARKTLDNMRGA